MNRAALLFLLVTSILAFPRAQAGPERLDYETIGSIRDEGLHRSPVRDPSAGSPRRY